MPRYWKFIRNGRSVNGGSYTWDLPTRKRPGTWTRRTSEVQVCNVGYHLMTDYGLLDWLCTGQLYVAEGRGEQDGDGYDYMSGRHRKVAFQEARLMQQVAWSPDTLYTWVLEVFHRFPLPSDSAEDNILGGRVGNLLLSYRMDHEDMRNSTELVEALAENSTWGLSPDWNYVITVLEALGTQQQLKPPSNGQLRRVESALGAYLERVDRKRFDSYGENVPEELSKILADVMWQERI